MSRQAFSTSVKRYMSAAYPILAVETHEETRLVSEIRTIAKDNETMLFEWDLVNCLTRTEMTPKGPIGIPVLMPGANNQPAKPIMDPWSVIDYLIKQEHENAIVIFKDMGPLFESNARVARALRNALSYFKSKGILALLIGARLNLPTELVKDTQMVQYALPTREELGAAFRNYAQLNMGDPKLSDNTVTSVAEAAMGMTSAEADNAFALATIVAKVGKKNPQVPEEFVRCIFEEKITNLRASALEYKPTSFGFESVGGLDNIKAWALERRAGFDEEARALHLPYPKGALLVGVQGCGKTLMGQAIAHQFGFPFFLLDLGKLFAGKVGESEALTRDVIRLMMSLGRAVVMIDELEKSMSTQATSGAGDSGTSSRMFGTLLSWMSLKEAPVFILGTVNNCDRLPPELIRKGRFDEIWFVDLPTATERVSIFNALLEYKFKRAERLGEKDELIRLTAEFSGAEIEAVIVDALYRLLRHKGDFMKHLLEAVKQTTPQAKIDPEKIERLREKTQAFKKASSAARDLVEVPQGKRRLVTADPDAAN